MIFISIWPRIGVLTPYGWRYKKFLHVIQVVGNCRSNHHIEFKIENENEKFHLK